MKVLIKAISVSGEPLDEGQLIMGKTNLEIVTKMQMQTPFTMRKSLMQYMKDILYLVSPQNIDDLGECVNEITALKFLLILQNINRVRIVDKEELEIKRDSLNEKGKSACADK